LLKHTESNLTEEFAATLYTIKKQDVSTHIQHLAKRCLLDYIGATLAGAAMVQEKTQGVLLSLGEEGSSSVVGLPSTTSLMNATLVNGLNSHSAELDDGVISAIVHPGSPILSALLPVAEKERVRGTDLLLGIIVGYEAAVRLGDTIQPGHKLRGYHATATCGAVGAAAAIAAMLDLSEDTFRASIATALVSAFGTLKVLEGSSELKPFNSGQAAVGALMAVSLAKSGFKPPDDPLSGDFGFLRMTADATNKIYLTATESNAYAIERVYTKSHAACRYCHSPIDATIKLLFEHDLKVEDVQSVSVQTYELAVRNHDHTEIESSSSAKMSIPYSVAVALSTGKAGMREFDTQQVSAVNNTGLAKKVVVQSDDELTALYPDKNPATVTIKTNNGETYVERVDYPKGEPANPMSDKELEDKFSSLAEYRGWNPRRIRNAIDSIWGIDLNRDLSGLWASIYPKTEDKE
jgi:2-methylcitrate dehydratase PrpD